MSGIIRKEDMHDSFWQNGVSNPNLLINGDFRIWQREISFDISPNGLGTYSCDRWYLANTGSFKITKHGVRGVAIQSFSDANNNNRFGTILDGLNKYIAGKKVTLTVRMCSMDVERKIGLLISTGNSIQYADLGKLTGKEVTIDTTMRNYFLTVEVPNSFYDSSSYLTVQLGLSNINGSEETPYCGSKQPVVFEKGGIVIEYVKLEIGDKATPFYPRSYGEELALCQRYLQVIKKGIAFPIAFYYDADNNIRYLDFFIPLATAMRVTPTFKNPNNADVRIKDLDNNVSITGQTVVGIIGGSAGGACENFRLSTPREKGLKNCSCYFWGDCFLDAEIY